MPPTFNDVATTDTFYHEIEALFAAGITAGTSTSPPLFSPLASCTISQMMIFLTRCVSRADTMISKTDTAAPAMYTDVNQSHWAFGNIQKAAKLGIPGTRELDDFTPGLLGEATAVKRKWAVTWIVRALAKDELTVTTARFTDVPLGYYLIGWIERAVALGVTVGTSATLFSPDDTMTRGQMAAFLVRAFGLPFVTAIQPLVEQ